MFGLLKKKIGEFIGKLTSKEEEKADEKNADITSPTLTSGVSTSQKSNSGAFSQPVISEPTSLTSKGTDENLREKMHSVQNAPEPRVPSLEIPSLKPEAESPATRPRLFDVEKKPFPSPKTSPENSAVGAPATAEKKEVPERVPPIPAPLIRPSEKRGVEQPAPTQPTPPDRRPSFPWVEKQSEIPFTSPSSERMPLPSTETKSERKMEPKIGFLSKIKSVFTNEVQIQEKEILPLLNDLNMAMLESDVSLDTADHLSIQLKERLVGQKIQKDQLAQKVRQTVRTVLAETLSGQTLNLASYIRSREKPVKILFLGPNGAGKTTTLAKVAHQLKKEGLFCVLAAGDTFRAAAIEQLSHHASKIGVKVIKHQYASDPAAVAFDAIAHAKTHHLDAVLIDTAGRQETNYNLLKEMEKINRVVKPDLKLFVGEAVAGHAIVEQAKAFHEALKLDGIVLTKLDCDAKGGTSFSLCHELKIPIVYLGVGQGYDDLRPFDAIWLLDNVLAE